LRCRSPPDICLAANVWATAKSTYKQGTVTTNIPIVKLVDPAPLLRAMTLGQSVDQLAHHVLYVHPTLTEVLDAATKQGSTLVRWAAIEACQHTRPGTKLAADRARIIAARGRNIGVVAAARKLLTYVYYGLRDGEIRALAKGAA
jgi:hypothetical protein